jgi:hypothetical protein
MKTIFEKLSERLCGIVAIKWVDMDYGQLEYYTMRPEVAFPAVLLDISYPQCRDFGDSWQSVTASIVLRVAFRSLGETYSTAPQEVKDRALGIFDTLNEIHSLLQGWDGDGAFSSLSRVSVVPEKRKDGYKVYSLRYDTAFTDSETSPFA